MNNKNLILEATNLKKSFGKGHTLVKAVSGISLKLFTKEIVIIMGPSGSGKTTLVTMLGALLKPDSGSILIEEQNIIKLSEGELSRLRQDKIGFIFQSFNLLSSLNVLENVMVPYIIKHGNHSEAESEAKTILKRLNLEKRKHHLPKDLSGGEKQRVAIARALINNPQIILADEPTANLDSENGEEVMKILKEIAFDQGKTVVIVSHDTRIQDISSRTIHIENGEIKA